MGKLESLLQELETKIPYCNMLQPTVSKGSVGWHIEHTLLTLNVIVDALKKSDPASYKWTFDWRRTLVIATGIIPRGKVKAPSIVQPTVNYTIESLQQHLANSKEHIICLAQLTSKHFFKHPFLGDIQLKPAIKFISVHTAHHLHIINDIIRSGNR